MSVSSPTNVTPKKDIGVLMVAPMVRATLAGTKTETRRLLYVPTKNGGSAKFDKRYPMPERLLPVGHLWTLSRWYGVQAGRRLWVRETCAQNQDQLSDTRMNTSWVYAADDNGRALDNGCEKAWTPSIHMPRRACRIELETVADVRVERVQAITEAAAIAEGIEPNPAWGGTYRNYSMERERQVWTLTPIESYRTLWDSINGMGSWDSNPWVCVIKFKRVKP